MKSVFVADYGASDSLEPHETNVPEPWPGSESFGREEGIVVRPASEVPPRGKRASRPCGS